MTDKELKTHEKFSGCSGVGKALIEFEELSNLQDYSFASHLRSKSQIPGIREPLNKSLLADQPSNKKTVQKLEPLELNDKVQNIKLENNIESNEKQVINVEKNENKQVFAIKSAYPKHKQNILLRNKKNLKSLLAQSHIRVPELKTKNMKHSKSETSNYFSKTIFLINL